MKKIFLRTFLIVILLIVLSKIYEFTVISKIYNSIENFKTEENRYCSVCIKENETKRKEELFIKNKIYKYYGDKENSKYIEWKNFDKNEQCTINEKNNKCYKNKPLLYLETGLLHIPRFMLDMSKNDTFNINVIFEVHCVLPTKYNDKACYKVITNNEIIIIDKETYLPVYSSTKLVNGKNNYKIEYNYEFEIGNVTDEDVKLPDLNDYIIIE